MFTGIVEGLGEISAINKIAEGSRFSIRPLFRLDDLKVGDSISVDGVCLTIVMLGNGVFHTDVSKETISRSTLGELIQGHLVNLERALKLGDRLGGHIVMGHVDGIGRITRQYPVERSVIIGIKVEERLSRYMVEKGSVTVNGISLTINRCEKGYFEVNIIPHTYQATNLRYKKVGDSVNIEVDILAKYVESLLGKDFVSRTVGGSTLTEEKLREYGFGD